MPKVAEFDGIEAGHLYYGLRLDEPCQTDAFNLYPASDPYQLQKQWLG